MSNSTEEDTFNALRRPSVDVVDEQMLICFDMPQPISPYLRDTYAIVLEDDNDRALMQTILLAHHWNMKDYIKQSVIEWEGIVPPRD